MENFDNRMIEKKERQIENLENLIENHTRTERHLEQYSNLGDRGNKENAREKQKIREQQIEELENRILGLDPNQIPQVQFENLTEKYESIQGYINNNRDTIPKDILEKLEEKQDSRRRHIENLKFNG